MNIHETKARSITRVLPEVTWTTLPPHDGAPRNEFVYFMYSGGRVKIGYSRGTDVRLKRLQASGPFPPVLILLMHGTIGDEQDLHVRFHAERLHGEWFTLSKGLREYLRPRLCDIGRASLDGAEEEFRSYCSTFLTVHTPPPRRTRRQHCEHGMPIGSICAPCKRTLDLSVLERLRTIERIEGGVDDHG